MKAINLFLVGVSIFLLAVTAGPVKSDELDDLYGDASIRYRPLESTLFEDHETWPPDEVSDGDIEILRNVICTMKTTKGIIRIRLFPDEAPIHSANFAKLIQDGYYDGLTFHRVIKEFMSQGGDPSGTGAGGPDYTLPAEIELPHLEGSVAAARTGDAINPERRSSGSQFYMVHTDTSGMHLDGSYTVFGQIIEGFDVNRALNCTYYGYERMPKARPDRVVHARLETAEIR